MAFPSKNIFPAASTPPHPRHSDTLAFKTRKFIFLPKKSFHRFFHYLWFHYSAHSVCVCACVKSLFVQWTRLVMDRRYQHVSIAVVQGKPLLADFTNKMSSNQASFHRGAVEELLSLSDGLPFLEFLIKRLTFLSCVIILMLVVRVIISYYKFSNADAWAANAINVLNFLSPIHAAFCFHLHSFNLGCSLLTASSLVTE